MLAFGVAALAIGRAPEQAWQPRSRGERFDPLSQPGVYEKLPAQKRAEVDKRNELLAEAAKTPYIQQAGERPPLVEPTPFGPRIALPHRAAGAGMIVEGGCGVQELHYDFYAANAWWWSVDGETIRVCAGRQASDASQGLILVRRQTADRTLDIAPPAWFPAGGSVGNLSIVEASGHVLTVRTKGGSVLYFDAGSLKYVDGPPVEKATPVPVAAAP
jgi:hypothetical protein